MRFKKDTSEYNLVLLANIIYSKKGSFTVRQIMAEYKEKKGDLYIDLLESVPGFIDGLVELGMLSNDAGVYRVRSEERLHCDCSKCLGQEQSRTRRKKMVQQVRTQARRLPKKGLSISR